MSSTPESSQVRCAEAPSQRAHHGGSGRTTLPAGHPGKHLVRHVTLNSISLVPASKQQTGRRSNRQTGGSACPRRVVCATYWRPTPQLSAARPQNGDHVRIQREFPLPADSVVRALQLLPHFLPTTASPTPSPSFLPFPRPGIAIPFGVRPANPSPRTHVRPSNSPAAPVNPASRRPARRDACRCGSNAACHCGGRRSFLKLFPFVRQLSPPAA